MDIVRSVTKNITVLSLANIAEKLLYFVLVIFMARYLGDAEFGKFIFAISFCNIFVILSDFGLNTFLIREIAREKEKTGEYVGNVFL